ncbi:hypothetical protein [Cellulomonas sp. C5510]|uniref:hypothetical protein n=1 Tax=Cellulomonas sp. C5510 TaxID=2871170 RepID=UPI001C96E1DF|nr:hypothetical protein [Cellulomonas sp. C5510]QZN86601.1 hypothetical protein K5O09_05490 [Cellulomonas sp. C5510]
MSGAQSAPAALPVDTRADPAVVLAVARVEAKIDVVLAQHEAKLEAHGHHLADHETRLRALEARSTVSPRALWTTVSGAAVLLVTLSPFLTRLLGATP